MRLKLLIALATLATVWVGGIWRLKDSRRAIQKLTARIQASASENPEYWKGEWQRLGILAREKAFLYDTWIEEGHLESGMVVSRHADGRAGDECDSLLFSSLRYTALKKLGWDDRASKAWKGIENSLEVDRIVRHPKCRRKSTSRDMIVGLLVALTQNPPAEMRRLQQMFSILTQTGGNIDKNSEFYVSRLSPGIGEIMRLMSQQYGVPVSEVPEEVRMGFSTLELDTWMASAGYTAHLNALTLWIELELTHNQPKSALRSLSELVDTTLGPLGSPRIQDQRLSWVGHKLASLDRQNLFFEWMELSSVGALTWKTQAQLLQKLLAMPQFPDEHLPRNCDRKADYLWQRASNEYGVKPKTPCTENFHGVDFLWMVALLTENL